MRKAFASMLSTGFCGEGVLAGFLESVFRGAGFFEGDFFGKGVLVKGLAESMVTFQKRAAGSAGAGFACI
jgi:hypothetical protein